MNTRLGSTSATEHDAIVTQSSWLDRLARRVVLSRLEKLQVGRVVVTESDRQIVFGYSTPEFPTVAQLKVLSPKFYSTIAFGGSVGAGEAYMQGYWECSELSELLRILIRNREVLEKWTRASHC